MSLPLDNVYQGDNIKTQPTETLHYSYSYITNEVGDTSDMTHGD